MQGVVFEHQSLPLLAAQRTSHEVQVAERVGTVDLVSHDGMAQMGQMDANLVFAPGQGPCPHPGKRPASANELRECLKMSHGRSAVGPNPVLDRNRALLILAQRSVHLSRAWPE